MVHKRIYDLGSGLNMYSTKMLENKFYHKFPDRLTFNYCMILAAHFYKQNIKFFPISWREADQVSNVKLTSQAFNVLGMLFRYAFNHENGEIKEYDFPATMIDISELKKRMMQLYCFFEGINFMSRKS